MYPLDHPTCKVFNKRVNWTTPKQMGNFQPITQRPMLNGIIKCFVVPPMHSLYPPVLPMRMDKRLLFAFCATCAKKYKIGFKDPNYYCTHSDGRQRGFVALRKSFGRL